MSHASVKPRRKTFRWVFLAVQVVFLLWLVVGVSAASGTGNGDATDAGTAIGAAIILSVWFMVDAVLGMAWAIWKWAR